MKFPFVTRSHHEEVVNLLRSQLAGLARTLYGGDVPKEFQMLLGIEIPDTGEKPVEPKEPVLTHDEQIEEEEAQRQARNRAELTSRMRTRPSTVGPAMERIMKETTYDAAKAANPAVALMFEQAKKDALKK